MSQGESINLSEYFSVFEEEETSEKYVAEAESTNSDCDPEDKSLKRGRKGRCNLEWGPEDKSFKRPRKGRSVVWNFFDLSKNQLYAKCRMCGNIYKTSRNTSNLFDHLKRCDKREDQKTTTKRAPKCTKLRKTEINAALTRMIAVDVQPFRIVEDEGFRNFVKCLEPRYELPTRKELQNVHLKNMYDEMVTKLQVMLDDVKNCAITTGWWTSHASENYLSVTCHFVTNDYKIRSAVLSTLKLPNVTNLFAANIAETLRAALSHWNVLNKAVSIVTDNTTTMIKACDLLKIENIPCFAHTLNLLVQDVLTRPTIKFILTKCKRIVEYFQGNTIAYERLKATQQANEQFSLIQEQPSRWNSAYKMCNSILLTYDTIEKLLLTQAYMAFTPKEVELLEDICNLLSPFNDATDEIIADNCVTISLIIPIAFGLYTTLNNVKVNMKTTKGIETCNYLIQCLQDKIFSYELLTATRLSTLLDPRFKKEGFRNAQNANLAVKTLEKVMLSIAKDQANEDPLALSNATGLQNKTDMNAMLSKYLKLLNKPKDFDPLHYWKINGVELEGLRQSALRYLCIPATTVESERMFSKDGEVFADRRSSVKSQYVNMLLFVRKNQWLLNM